MKRQTYTSTSPSYSPPPRKRRSLTSDWPPCTLTALLTPPTPTPSLSGHTQTRALSLNELLNPRGEGERAPLPQPSRSQPISDRPLPQQGPSTLQPAPRPPQPPFNSLGNLRLPSLRPLPPSFPPVLRSLRLEGPCSECEHCFPPPQQVDEGPGEGAQALVGGAQETARESPGEDAQYLVGESPWEDAQEPAGAVQEPDEGTIIQRPIEAAQKPIKKQPMVTPDKGGGDRNWERREGRLAHVVDGEVEEVNSEGTALATWDHLIYGPASAGKGRRDGR